MRPSGLLIVYGTLLSTIELAVTSSESIELFCNQVLVQICGFVLFRELANSTARMKPVPVLSKSMKARN
jgi:hypothetical protein